MKKIQNRCAVTFGLRVREEKLGFSPKVTRFFSSRTFLRPLGVLQGDASLLFREFILKLG